MPEIIDKESLLIQVDEAWDKYDDRKDRNRGFAVGIRVTTAFLGAAISVLLGWKHGKETVEWMTNLALVFGACVSVMTSIDTFFSFSSRWTHYKGICSQLFFLRNEIQNSDTADEKTLTGYKSRLNNIILETKKGEMEFHNKRK